jgi:hypothetical protein
MIDNNYLQHGRDCLEAASEIERLREELDDWRGSARRAADEDCGDERHCTCVGPLRSEIERLRKERDGAFSEAGFEKELCKLTRTRADRAEARLRKVVEMYWGMGEERREPDELDFAFMNAAGYERCERCKPAPHGWHAEHYHRSRQQCDCINGWRPGGESDGS